MGSVLSKESLSKLPGPAVRERRGSTSSTLSTSSDKSITSAILSLASKKGGKLSNSSRISDSSVKSKTSSSSKTSISENKVEPGKVTGGKKKIQKKLLKKKGIAESPDNPETPATAIKSKKKLKKKTDSLASASDADNKIENEAAPAAKSQKLKGKKGQSSQETVLKKTKVSEEAVKKVANNKASVVAKSDADAKKNANKPEKGE